MTRKEAFKELLNKNGYNSVNHFCIMNKLNQSNFSNRVRNESIQVELPILFMIANILHEPIEKVIEIFYPKEFKENRESMKKN